MIPTKGYQYNLL